MKEVYQRGTERNPNRAPKNWRSFVKYAKVIKVRPAQNKIDVICMDGAGLYRNVDVISQAAGTAFGRIYIPKPYTKGTEDDEHPKANNKRDIYAVLLFVDALGTLPICIGFKHPEEIHLSFPFEDDETEGFENQLIDRHVSDRYHRIVGDTVEEFGGEDKNSEEELRYPDGSYFKVYDPTGSRALASLTLKNQDQERQKFKVQKEERKGYYFQHSSGTKVLIDPDGRIKVSHHTGTWLSIAPETDDVAAASGGPEVINSQTNPPTVASSATTQIYLKHSSGAYFHINAAGDVTMHSKGGTTIDADGNVSVHADGAVNITGGGTVSIASATKITGGAPEIDLG